ncbi:MAG TPA: carboxypeptidase-like regulatory domain-containing protein [Crocinitomicaceae bacterium]|nr:carboxypeptidase-like regulatory domain-containing protein [Crocinitomicaceae bacterium]
MRILLICFLFISQITLGQDGFGKIKGHLNYINDEPAKHFFVELKDEQQQTVKQTYTYADGTFYFDSIVPDFYSVVATVPDSLELPDANKCTFRRPNYNTKLIEEVQITSYFTHFIDVTLYYYKREVVEMRAGCLPYYSTKLIDEEGRFNGVIKREDIIQRP